MEVRGRVSIFRHNHPDTAIESVGMEDIGDGDGRDTCLSGLENKNSNRLTFCSLSIYCPLYLLLVAIKLKGYLLKFLFVNNLKAILKVSLWVFLPVIKS